MKLMMIKTELLIKIVKGIAEYLANLLSIFRSKPQVIKSKNENDVEDVDFLYEVTDGARIERLEISGSGAGKYGEEAGLQADGQPPTTRESLSPLHFHRSPCPGEVRTP